MRIWILALLLAGCSCRCEPVGRSGAIFETSEVKEWAR